MKPSCERLLNLPDIAVEAMFEIEGVLGIEVKLSKQKIACPIVTVIQKNYFGYE